MRTKIPLTSQEGSADAPARSRFSRERSRGAPRTLVLPPRILISNGFNRFYLGHLAAGLRQRGWDVELLTGAYPSGAAAAILRSIPFQQSHRLGRLEDRRVGIDRDRVHADFTSELVWKTGQVVGSKGVAGLGAALEVAGFRLAGLRAARTVRKARRLSAYHFRSGFGLASLDAARRRGVPTICDHSTVHPAVFASLGHNAGWLPAGWTPGEPQGIWRMVLADLRRADWIVVNSNFVRETFEWAGVETTRVKVIYLGVEPAFLRSIPARIAESGGGPLRILFAGQVGPWKGADVLFRALSALKSVDWRLDLIGPMTPAFGSDWSTFLGNPRVTWHGVVPRPEVAGFMSRADVFVFPSLVEGSARVVPEAMAAGCYVITTHNSGSIVEDGVHGRVMPVGEHEALVTALEQAAGDRGRVSRIGRTNADVIKRHYLLEHYAERVDAFYREILGCGPNGEGLA